MAESKKMEPWQLILILILVLAFFGGLYLVNEAISSRLDSLETAIDTKTDSIKSDIDVVSKRLDAMRDMHRAKMAAAAPAPAEPAEEAAEGGEEGKPEGAGEAEAE